MLVVDKVASLALAMMFPPSNPVRALPANAAAWARVAAATRESHYMAWGDDVLVDVHASKLATALPNMQYVTISGQQHLPLNVIVYLLGRLGWVEDYRLQVDLASGLSAATLASFEEWAVTDGRLDWTPTNETAFLQRVLSLAAELGAAGALPAALKVTADSFVPFEGHDDSAGGPDWSDSWQSRVKVSSLTQGGMLGPYADIILLLGPMLREGVRTDPGGRPMLVAATLAVWSTSGSLSGLSAVHQQLPLLVCAAFKKHALPIELCACVTDFPDMLLDLDARHAWSDASKRPSVLLERFPCALSSLPALDELLAGEAEATKFDTACVVLAAQLPKVSAPSLAAFHQLDRHLAAEGFDLSGGTAAERMDAIAARDARDVDLRAAAPYGGSGSGGGNAKTALQADPKARLHVKASVKVLQLWLNSLEVSGPLAYATAPIAAAFGVAPVAGVIDEARSGVAALVAHHHALGDSFEVLRVALGRRSVPLTQSVVFDVSTSHPLFDAISSARGALAAYVSAKLATRDDGNLEMPCDDLWRASPDFVTKLIEGKWKGINWHDDVLRPILNGRCKSSAPAAVADTDRQWFCPRAAKVVTYADRGLAILGYDRNSSFLTTVSETLEVADTTPGSAAAKSECQSHAARQIAERLDAAATRFRTYLGASSCVPFPSFTDETDKAASMHVEAVAARQLVTVMSRVMPSALHSGSGARAGDGKTADDDDDDDDAAATTTTTTTATTRGGGGGGDSKVAKKKRRKEKQAHNSSGNSRRGRAASHATPGDFMDRVQSAGDVVTFTWPSRDAKPESVRSFDAAGVKADLADFGVENADEICVPFQFMYAMSTNFGDDDYRLAHAYRFCPCPHDDGHDSVAAAAHEQAEGLDRDLINSWEC